MIKIGIHLRKLSQK